MMTKPLPSLLETQNCICINLRQTARAVALNYSKFLAETDLSETQFSILAALKQLGPVPMGKFSEALVMDRTTLTRNLRPLKNKDFVKTVPGNDGRTRLVIIKPSGSVALQNALPAWQRAQNRLLNLYGANEWDELRNNLNLLQNYARADP